MKKLQRALQINTIPDNPFSKITNLVPALIAVYNIRTGKYTYINDTLTKILGYKKEEWLTKGASYVASFVHPDDLKHIMSQNQKALLEANRKRDKSRIMDSIVSFEYRIKHKKGNWVWLKTDGVVFDRNAKGKVEHVMNISIDITERKEKELKETAKREETEAEQSRLAAIVESSDDAIISKNLNGIIKSWNKGAERIFGYKSKEAIGKHITLIIPENLRKEEVEIIKNIKNGKRIDHYETIRLRKDGGKLNISLTISPVKDQNGIVIGASKIARDITRQKELERQKDDFLGIASHELKTPVTSIKSFAQVLKLRFEREGNKNAVDILGKLNNQVDKLRNLIGDLLDVTKIESGRMQLSKSVFLFDELVDEIIEELQWTTKKNALIKKGKTGKKIYADRERVGQVLTNLLSNAIKYSPSSKDINVFSSVENSHIKLSVQDFGIGIAKSKHEKVFERFFRVSGPRKDTYPGLGLGLYISSDIIKRSGGRIWVESVEKKGSRFCFLLPIKTQ